MLALKTVSQSPLLRNALLLTPAVLLALIGVSHAQHNVPILTCPEGTTVDREESNSTRIICDVDSDDNPDPATDLDVYPYPDTEPHIIHETDLPPLVNRNYPEWYRGQGPDGLADENAHHIYYFLLGPGAPAPGYDTENLFCSSFYLMPGKTYLAHNHPARELYYV
ncbi:MAG: hypothetical protein SAJ12_20445, partial [Jaaginema sp. PMC 1079.18]|nr:hypothetical protein [Jaaginema sp. PMC 1079.18]